MLGWKGKKIPSYYDTHLKENETGKTEVLPGAFMMVERKVLNEVGAFDEDFFMYGEDIDLSKRVRKSGKFCYYFGDATIIHFKGESTQKKSADYHRHFYGAMITYLDKHPQSSSFRQFLSKTGIRTMQQLSIGKSMAQRIFSRERKPKYAVETLIIADPPTFHELLKIVQHANPPIMITGRVATDNRDMNATATLPELPAYINKKKPAQLLLSSGKMTVSKLIELMETFAGRVQILIHLRGSSAVIGSQDKNNPGSVIHAPDASK